MTDVPRVLPYGSWPSPITAASLVAGAAAVGEVRADGEDVWWSELRPAEGGRTQLVRRSVGGGRHDLFPAVDPAGEVRAWNARTAVLEYGGGAWAVRDGTVVFADWADQRLYRVDPTDGTGVEPVAITPEPSVPRGLRYSEPTWLDPERFPGWIVCVRESHEPGAVAGTGEAVDELVALPIDGSAVDDPSRVRVLHTGPDFVHSPATRGDQLAWIEWDHPRMPWDGTQLRLAGMVADEAGGPCQLLDVRTVAGGVDESIVQPGFLADGTLAFCTDRTGWWNPWREVEPGRVEPMIAGGGAEVEVGGPLWVGGLRWWAELAPGRLLVSARSEGADALAIVEPDGELRVLDAPFTDIGQVVAAGDGHDALVVAGSPTSEPTPHLVDVLDDGGWPLAGLERLRPAAAEGPDPAWISAPTPIAFESVDGRIAHGLHYAPRNPDATGPAGERPPLIVMIHGGPTSHARQVLALAKQFWTSRGFAVVDVDHGGSTGYGRPFRQLLAGRWGIVDVEDAAAAARHLAEEGLADGDHLAIRGGSAGGFTTLAALCFGDTFAAGASHYGVADLSALAADTHKFESRYLDGLVGRWPEDRATYEARSPIHHTDGFAAPLIVLQGSEDEVVPPNQAEMIVAALAAKGIPHAYVLFEGEQHGFRRAESIVRALEAELWFYGRVFGFEPADPIEPVAGAVGL
ncbi:MAG: S9 family peptidase [Acidimicrobiales bacterium]|nr:S9 family peptidase [Acidimicrobiales bacterium]HRW36835.1 prolyl oligopeptidase family serine peptidase [Aquihabitans sp.]